MTTTYEVPFNQPTFDGNELAYIMRAVEKAHTSGMGPFTQQCEALLEEALGVPRVLLTPSCTHALEMSALLLGLDPGDEVVVPSFTFVSTATAFAREGARPVFCDIRPDTFNLDEVALERLITPNTKAIVPVHYAGVGCEMNRILELANAHDIAVVEDNAHGLFGRYHGRYLGTIGTFGTQSFHETKNFSCGEGGALIVNDERFVDRAEIIRDRGTNRSQFLRGDVGKYTWVDTGSSYLLSDILAGVLLAQLERRDVIQEHRKRIWQTYHASLEGWAKSTDVQLPIVPLDHEPSYHNFALLLPTRERRDALIEHLKGRGVHAVFHYIPLHLSPAGQSWGGAPGQCPVAEDVSERLVRLPFFAHLDDRQSTVIDAVLDF
ncbi:MAG: dTDP-4-amino-4,6-dideoxygalactose transaminase [Myxococcota bacterium]